jgi:hypothetical protein
VDALIVFTSVKYLAILITADNLLLRAAEPVKAAVKAQIMTARQAIELVRSQISGRDQMARPDSIRERTSVPVWAKTD